MNGTERFSMGLKIQRVVTGSIILSSQHVSVHCRFFGPCKYVHIHSRQDKCFVIDCVSNNLTHV